MINQQRKITSDILFESVAEDMLKLGYEIRFRAHGDSMVPSIQNGDILTVEPGDRSRLETGDVVFYRHSKGKYTAHRLVEKHQMNRETYFITKGDNCDYPDDPVCSQKVLGKITGIEYQVERKHKPGSYITYLTSSVRDKVHVLFKGKTTAAVSNV